MPRGRPSGRTSEAGTRLKRAIREAMPAVNVPSLLQLAARAEISYDVLYDWFGGATVPTPRLLTKVAVVLNVPASSLWAAYEGIEGEPVTLIEAVNAQTVAMQQLVEEMRRLLPLAGQGIAEAAVEEAQRAAVGRAGRPSERQPRRQRRSLQG